MSKSRNQKLILAAILLVPVVIVAVILLLGLRGKEITPKWRHEPARVEAPAP